MIALVIGLSVVLTMIGGRLVRYGVRVLRPDPDRIKVKLRPKQLELAVDERHAEQNGTVEDSLTAERPITTGHAAQDDRQDVPAPV